MIQKLGQRFVKASMDLEGSANQRLARIRNRNIQVAQKDSSMDERIASYMAARQQAMPIKNEAVAEEIIPENSINYIA